MCVQFVHVKRAVNFGMLKQEWRECAKSAVINFDGIGTCVIPSHIKKCILLQMDIDYFFK